MALIPNTELDVFGLNLGGNVFGWTADKDQTFAVLDAYVAGGGNFLDTADLYSAFVDGMSGGESETIIGEWFAKRKKRDDIVLATKVGMWAERPGLSKDNIIAAAEDSLRRLQTDYIDLYYAHRDDENTPQEETLAAFDQLRRDGKVREIAASNFTADRLRSAMEISERENLARYVAFQPHYNLMERTDFEQNLRPTVEEFNLAVFPYFALAKGFLTGKYREQGGESDAPLRAEASSAYADERGNRVIDALDEVAKQLNNSIAAVALAWLRQQQTVLAPIASARNLKQLPALLASTHITLTDDQLDSITRASD